jgi:hypothetical protein
MADTKISALPASTTPLAGTEVLPIVQSSTTRQVSVANLTAGRAISATSVTASTGNFVVGTSGQGIDFSATPGTGTSELFADYEEGTWTPTDASGAGLSITVINAYYTKIGRVVNFYLDVTYPSTVDASNAYLSLPFTATADGGGGIGYNNIAYATQLFANVASSIGVVRLLTNAGLTLTNATLSTKRFQITGQYTA